MEEVDDVFSVVVAGDSGSGKTSLITRLSTGKFREDSDFVDNSISGLMSTLIVKLSESWRVRLNIWDTISVDDYKDLNSCHFADVQGCIFVFSLNDSKALKNLPYTWKMDLDRNSLSPHELFLVGTKSDLPKEEITVKEEDVKEIAAQLGAEYFSVSSLNGDGIEDLKLTIAQILVQKFGKQNQQKKKKAPTLSVIAALEKDSKKKKKKGRKSKQNKKCSVF